MATKLLIRTLLLVSLSAFLFGADAQPGAEVLNRWVGGKWVGDGAMLDTDYSKAMKTSGVSNCGWSPDHVFVVCDQQVSMGGKEARVLSLYAYDPDTHLFHFYGLSPAGERPRTGEVTITADGAHWEYHSKAEIGGKPVEFRTINVFADADHVNWWSEYSTDGGAKWVRTGAGKESRQK